MRKGFTLIEILVVIAISAMLSAIALTYTSIGRNQIAVTVASSEISGIIFRAKNLAIATYSNVASGICGYGVFFNVANDTYSLFAFRPDASKYGGSLASCPSVASTTAAGISSSTEMVRYSSSEWNVPLANGVRLISGGKGDDLAVALFIPPAPVTLVSRNGTTFIPATTTASHVYLLSVDGRTSSTVSMNSAGQVNF